MQKFIVRILTKIKPVVRQNTKGAFFLFETIITISMFFSIIIVIFNVMNFSNHSFERNLQHFQSICKIADFYNENLNNVGHTGETVSFGEINFVKVPVTTDVGIKYVFIKK